MVPTINIGMTVMSTPESTYSSPSPCTTVSQNPLPALMPTLARKSTRPISRSIILALVVV